MGPPGRLIGSCFIFVGVPRPIPLAPARNFMQIPGLKTPNGRICVKKPNFPFWGYVYPTETTYFDISMVFRSSRTHLRSFLGAVRFILTEYEPISSHGEPI